MMPDETEIWPDSKMKMSLATQMSGQKHTKTVQCMPSFSPHNSHTPRVTLHLKEQGLMLGQRLKKI